MVSLSDCLCRAFHHQFASREFIRGVGTAETFDSKRTIAPRRGVRIWRSGVGERACESEIMITIKSKIKIRRMQL